VITKCVLNFLKKGGEEYADAYNSVREVKREQCPHNNILPVAECLSQMLENGNKYFFSSSR